ncbi:MAG: LexA family transcriptional regulator [Alphaproteobacteria bacterium]|nr:LexA family transcriptional regulator [Alphaproteobacteria bacterium]
MAETQAMREPFWELGQRIKTLRKQQNLTQQEFAAKLGVTQPTVHRWEKGAFEPDAQTLKLLAETAGASVSEFRYGRDGGSQRLTTVTAYVGAGGEVFALNGGASGTRDEVEAPPDDSLSIIALRVRGDSLYPVYSDGDILFYSRDLQAHGVDVANCAGRDCVVKIANGPTLVKRLEIGGSRGQFTLVSYNAAPVMNTRLEWASPVRWVKRR